MTKIPEYIIKRIQQLESKAMEKVNSKQEIETIRPLIESIKLLGGHKTVTRILNKYVQVQQE